MRPLTHQKSLAQRCEEIAKRLKIYRQDGLTQLTYRSDPNTTQQYVICAKTNLDIL